MRIRKLGSAAFACLMMLVVSMGSRPASCDPLDSWRLRNPLRTGNALRDVTYANSTFVAVGDKGTILVSPDGAVWSPRPSGTTNDLCGVTHENGIFVTVGDGGTILTSPEGAAWTPRTSGTTERLCGVTCGNRLFVAVGYAGTILTSTDGVTWTNRTFVTSRWLNRVAHGKGVFVAVGDGGMILTSSDGATWRSRDSGLRSGADLVGIAFANGRFVAVGYLEILTSPDGTSWETRASATMKPLLGVTYGNSVFVAVGDGGAILTSPDGTAWTARTSGSTKWLWSVTCAGDTFVAVGTDGTILQSDPVTSAGAVPRIGRGQAIEIALKRIRTEALAEEVDFNHMTVRYGTFGPRGKERTGWMVDFARKDAREITPGQWETGYQVVIDPGTGAIIEATWYER